MISSVFERIGREGRANRKTKNICSILDYLALQEDITSIATWVTENCLSLNADKCCCMLFSKKRLHSVPPVPLHVDGRDLSMVSQTKYLRVLLSSDMPWSPHINAICVKARRLVGLLYRKFYSWSDRQSLLTLYTAYVRPHLEYCSCVWDPFLQKDVDLLEGVQKFALKVCCKQWSASYQELLDASHLSSLQTRRENARLLYMYKIIHKLIDFPDAPLQLKPAPPYSSRNRNPLSLKLCHCRTSKFLNSYFPRTSSRWNNLPAAAVTSTSISSFKHNILT